MKQYPPYHIVSAIRHTLGEGPIRDPRSNEFLWVDAYRHGFYSVSATLERPVFHHTGFFTIGITPWGRKRGRYLLTAADGLYEWSPEKLHRIAEAPPTLNPQTHRFNDVTTAPTGEFLAGVMEWKPGQPGVKASGTLLLYRDRTKVEVLMEGLTLPNGMGFSPDRRWFYITDSLARTIYRLPCRITAGRTDFGAPEAFILSTDRPGVPDGMTVTADGSMLSARWGGGCIDRYSADGALMAQYAVPMSQPSSVAFGGAELNVLLVTSATEGMDEPFGESEGFVVSLDIDLQGLPEAPLGEWF